MLRLGVVIPPASALAVSAGTFVAEFDRERVQHAVLGEMYPDRCILLLVGAHWDGHFR